MGEDVEALHYQGALQLGRTIACGAISARALTEYFLQRIERSAALQAFSAVCADTALAAADAADAAHERGHRLSPLHGVPVVLKDSIELAGVPTSAGSLAWQLSTSTQTSDVVHRLLAAGMVVLGKTRMTEFAFGLSGQNPTQGTPRNPWDPTQQRAPGGSSSGAAVAVAAGLAPIALGGDSGGSVRAPASLNHLLGYKPSREWISKHGVIPLAPSLDALGVIARSVADARALATVIAGADQASDWLGIGPQCSEVTPGRLRVLDSCAFPVRLSAATQQLWRHALRRLQAAGWCLQRWAPEASVSLAELSKHNSTILSYEAYQAFAALARDPQQPLWCVVRKRILAGRQITAQQYRHALAFRARASELFWGPQAEEALLLMPVSPSGAMVLDRNDEAHGGLGEFCRAANFLDAPAIALPVGFDEAQMPVGFQLMATHGADHALLAAAMELEPLLRLDARNPTPEWWLRE